MKKNFRSHKLGFTLIEIVVVIAIVALLFAAGVTSYSKIRVNSRDSIRKSDLTAIRSALEQYRNIVGSYPATLPTLTPDYLPNELLDPQVNCSSYTYTPNPTNTQYQLCTDFETDGTFDCAISNLCATCGCDNPKLSNLQ